MSRYTRIEFVGLALSGAMLLASTSLAQPEGRRRGGEHGPHGEGMGPGGPMSPMSPMRMLRELDLSDDQRQQIRGLFEEIDATGVPARLRQARESLHDAIESGESGADEATLRQLASQLGAIEGDAAVEWARVHARIQEILTPEQKKELEQLKQEAKERMEMHRRQREERKARKGKSGADLL